MAPTRAANNNNTNTYPRPMEVAPPRAAELAIRRSRTVAPRRGPVMSGSSTTRSLYNEAVGYAREKTKLLVRRLTGGLRRKRIAAQQKRERLEEEEEEARRQGWM